jgi:hypothetical protein
VLIRSLLLDVLTNLARERELLVGAYFGYRHILLSDVQGPSETIRAIHHSWGKSTLIKNSSIMDRERSQQGGQQHGSRNEQLANAEAAQSGMGQQQLKQQKRDSMMAKIHAQAERVRRSFSAPRSSSQNTVASSSKKKSAGKSKDGHSGQSKEGNSVKREGTMPLGAFAPHVGLGMPAFKSSTFLPTSAGRRRGSIGIVVERRADCSQSTHPVSREMPGISRRSSITGTATPMTETQKRRRRSSSSAHLHPNSGMAGLHSFGNLSELRNSYSQAQDDEDALFFRSLAGAMETQQPEPAVSSDNLVLNTPPYPQITVNNNDVLFGHGVKMDSIGNRRLRVLLGLYQQEYVKTQAQDQKRRLTQTIVESIRNATPSGRFICFDRKTESWTETSQDSAESFVHGMLMTHGMSSGQTIGLPPAAKAQKQRRQSFVGRSA